MLGFIIGVLIGMAFEIGWILSEIREMQKEIKLLRNAIIKLQENKGDEKCLEEGQEKQKNS
jgi:uncharacterized membrane protein (DUF106 family)